MEYAMLHKTGNGNLVTNKVCIQACAAMILLIGSIRGYAQQPTAAHVSSTVARVETESVQSPAPKKPGEEPVRIHGHWVLDVKDINGKVVEHRDFENSLQQSGTDILALLLEGRASSGGFTIRAIQSTAGAMQTYQMSPDFLTRPTFPCPTGSTYAAALVYCVKGLQQAVVLPPGCAITNCTAGTTIQLQSQFTANAPIAVDTLMTEPLICKVQIENGTPWFVAPATCADNSSSNSIPGISTPYDFTGTTIAPLSIGAGQTLAISVTLSFS
jgi:hypothetical protein